MPDDSLRSVEVRIPREQVEPAIARLLDLAPGGFAEGSDGDDCVLTVYGSVEVVAAVVAAFPMARPGEVDPGWEDAWRAFHRPVVVGGIWIGPPWETPPSELPAVVIDPGRAFGTGAHPTTRLCVELLSRSPRGSLVDVGCGSGVLSLAAARLGFGPLRAVDVDPVAVEVTRENSAANAVEVDAAVVDATATTLPAADLAVVNILLPAVQLVLPRLASPIAITSGYFDHDRPDVPGWRAVDRVEADGWAADRLERVASAHREA